MIDWDSLLAELFHWCFWWPFYLGVDLLTLLGIIKDRFED
jgi:hypothetical protein